VNDSNYWGPPRHDLPLTHSTPNPTDSYHDPGIGGGSSWSTPAGTGGSYGVPIGSTSSSGSTATGVGFGGPVPRSKRSTIIAVALAFFFGPFGLFYAGILQGIAALIVVPVVVQALVFAIAAGRGGGPDAAYALAVPILWCIAIPWAIIGVKIRNARIDRAANKHK
jgi:hypothetical protein